MTPPPPKEDRFSGCSTGSLISGQATEPDTQTEALPYGDCKLDGHVCVSIEALQSNNSDCARKIKMQRMNSGETKTAMVMSTWAPFAQTLLNIYATLLPLIQMLDSMLHSGAGYLNTCRPLYLVMLLGCLPTKRRDHRKEKNRKTDLSNWASSLTNSAHTWTVRIPTNTESNFKYRPVQNHTRQIFKLDFC
jgi:hypothetical protein